MKNIVILFYISLIGFLQPLQAQILTVLETTEGRTDTILASGAQIVDINGNLEVSISKTKLAKNIQENFPQFTVQIGMESRIEALQKALVNQDSLLSFLKQKTLNKTDKKTFYKQLNSFYTDLKEEGNEDLRANANSLYREWEIKYHPTLGTNKDSGITKEIYILTNFNNNLIDAKNDLSKYEGQTFTISLLAFLKNKLGDDRVHIRNFDTYSERAITTVPRWVTSLSPAQEDKLKDLGEKAKDYNKKDADYFKKLKTELLDKFPDVTCMKEVKTNIENFLKKTKDSTGIKNEVRKYLTNVVTSYNSLITLLDKSKEDISVLSIDTPFEVLEDVKELITALNTIKAEFTNFTGIVVELKIINDETRKLGKQFNTCYRELFVAVTAVGQAMGILKVQQNAFDATTQIGKEVSKFSIDQIPATGYIQLKGAGPRENGDEIEITLVLRTPKTEVTGESTNLEENQILESQTLTLQLIGLRSETVVGIMLADSYNENNFEPIGDKRYLYAPVVSLLLKMGSRKSKFYNDFIDFGFGVAMSTPDFDRDGSPEFGAGLMFTAFKDILSVGINYNVTLDTPYLSFGINLPFTLPGVPINVPK